MTVSTRHVVFDFAYSTAKWGARLGAALIGIGVLVVGLVTGLRYPAFTLLTAAIGAIIALLAGGVVGLVDGFLLGIVTVTWFRNAEKQAQYIPVMVATSCLITFFTATALLVFVWSPFAVVPITFVDGVPFGMVAALLSIYPCIRFCRQFIKYSSQSVHLSESDARVKN